MGKPEEEYANVGGLCRFKARDSSLFFTLIS